MAKISGLILISLLIMFKKNVNIQNRKARFHYNILHSYEAGIKLLGTEIKSVREGRASLAESYCHFNGKELFIKRMNISGYNYGNINNHEPLRERKLLLHKKELSKLKIKFEKGRNYTIIPLRLYINNKGIAKIEIAMASGKKLYDKRHSIKEKDIKRNMEHRMKY